MGLSKRKCVNTIEVVLYKDPLMPMFARGSRLLVFEQTWDCIVERVALFYLDGSGMV